MDEIWEMVSQPRLLKNPVDSLQSTHFSQFFVVKIPAVMALNSHEWVYNGRSYIFIYNIL
jgi:hypothetical protein